MVAAWPHPQASSESPLERSHSERALQPSVHEHLDPRHSGSVEAVVAVPEARCRPWRLAARRSRRAPSRWHREASARAGRAAKEAEVEEEVAVVEEVAVAAEAEEVEVGAVAAEVEEAEVAVVEEVAVVAVVEEVAVAAVVEEVAVAAEAAEAVGGGRRAEEAAGGGRWGAEEAEVGAEEVGAAAEVAEVAEARPAGSCRSPCCAPRSSVANGDRPPGAGEHAPLARSRCRPACCRSGTSRSHRR